MFCIDIVLTLVVRNYVFMVKLQNINVSRMNLGNGRYIYII